MIKTSVTLSTDTQASIRKAYMDDREDFLFYLDNAVQCIGYRPNRSKDGYRLEIDVHCSVRTINKLLADAVVDIPTYNMARLFLSDFGFPKDAILWDARTKHVYLDASEEMNNFLSELYRVAHEKVLG